ncbi:MAG TPA: 50S ribosomal protein L25/general stress protein Ctc [Rhodocyclaceae bacterium]
MQFELNAQSRTLQGTGASRRLRHAGKVPGIVYGGTAQPTPVEVDHNELLLSLRKEAFHSSVITLVLDGKKESVLLRDVQAHAYKKLVLHVDFQRVDAKKELHIAVPLHFINGDIAPGVKLGGGIVSHVMTELEVKCLPADLPEFLEVDLKDLVAGHSLHVDEIKLPKGVKAVLHGGDNPVVATILTVRGDAAADEAEAADAATAAAASAAATPAATPPKA